MVLTRLVVLLYYSIWFFDKKFLSSTRKLQELTQLMKKWAQPAWHHSWGNLNFLWTVRGMTKWFWVTIEGYLSYILPKFEEFIPTGLGSGALNIHSRIYPYHSVCPRSLERGRNPASLSKWGSIDSEKFWTWGFASRRLVLDYGSRHPPTRLSQSVGRPTDRMPPPSYSRKSGGGSGLLLLSLPFPLV